MCEPVIHYNDDMFINNKGHSKKGLKWTKVTRRNTGFRPKYLVLDNYILQSKKKNQLVLPQ